MKKRKDTEKRNSLDDTVNEESDNSVESDDGVDVVFDDVEENTQTLIKKLRSKIRHLEKERGDNLTGWQRAKADYINLKKRMIDEKEVALDRGKEEALMSFVSIIDSFEIAMQGKAWSEADAKWKTGFESIYKQFISALKEQGVEEVGLIGEVFDPHLHTSVSLIEVDNPILDDTVAEVLQKGYKFTSGGVIRSPKVVVYKLKE